VTETFHPPNLGDVITASDVSSKGTGSYAAEYVNWCRVAHLLHVNAPGWQFHLRATPDGAHVWKAPNGTGYVVGYFTGPNGTETPDFPQAVMDNRNKAVSIDCIDARDLTDTHRRCLCTAAAAQFGLAWQLWAKESLEDPYQRERSADRKAPPKGVDRDKLQADVLRRLTDLGVRPEGIKAMVQRAGGPDCRALGQLPDATLQTLLTGVITAEKVSEWNGSEADPEEEQGPEGEDEDAPLLWQGAAT
jgi:hypothetical protein